MQGFNVQFTPYNCSVYAIKLYSVRNVLKKFKNYSTVLTFTVQFTICSVYTTNKNVPYSILFYCKVYTMYFIYTICTCVWYIIYWKFTLSKMHIITVQCCTVQCITKKTFKIHSTTHSKNISIKVLKINFLPPPHSLPPPNLTIHLNI